MRNRLACACGIVMLLPLFGEAAAQIIPVKTVPMAEGDQFTFLPSANRGMANVSIALPDSLLDPFMNPAEGSRLRRAWFFGSPSFYSLSKNGGSGSTIPVGGLLRSGPFFGGAAFAVQELSPPRQPDQVFPVDVLTAASLVPGTAVRVPHTNRYAFATLGRALTDHRLSVAGSIFWSRLSGVDGAELLYPGSSSVAQLGDAVNLRLGIVKDWEGDQSFEAVMVHDRAATSHDVSYQEFLWDPGTRTVIPRSYIDHNYDRRHLWGLHMAYERPLSDSGWRMGATLTANRTTSPTIPSFGIMNIARAPGSSAAFNAGVGVSRAVARTTFGADAIYEPIWSRSVGNGTDDRYRFSNALLRTGVQRDFEVLAPDGVLRLQLGAQVRAIRYTQDRQEVLQVRRSHQRWNEWTHTWGVNLKTSSFEAHYQWRLASGVERLGFPDFPGEFRAVDVSFFPGPSPQLTMLPVRVTTQQFSISVPIHE